MPHAPVQGHCPSCGQQSLGIELPQKAVFRDPLRVRCFHPACGKDTAAKILDDPEIHHIVRIGEDGYFNAKHPLRERVGSELLDCTIHGIVSDWLDEKSFAEHKEMAPSTWRVKHVGHDWEFERLPS